MSEETSSDYSGRKALVFTAVYIPIQVLCVALRYLSRYLVRGPWGFDDVLIMASLSFQVAMGIIIFCSIYYGGLGYHVPFLQETTPMTLPIWGKYLVAITLLYFWTVSIPKIAILVLFHRLFPDRRLRRTVVTLVGVLIALTLTTGITAFSACRPFAANWTPNLPGSFCLDKEGLFRWASFPNILTDVIMLVLPMPTIWNLHTSFRLKLGLIATFAVGSFGLVGSIVRFIIFFQKDAFINSTWAGVDLIIWTQLETGTYLISACLMTYRPILERLASMRVFNRLSSVPGSKQLGSKEDIQRGANFALHPRPQQGLTGFHTLMDNPCEESQIVVTTDIEVAHKDQRRDSRRTLGQGSIV